MALAIAGFAGVAGGTPHDDYTIPGAPFQVAADFLEARFPESSGTSARVVVHDHGSLSPKALGDLHSRLSKMRGVSLVAPPRMSADGDTALIDVQYRIRTSDFSGSEGLDALRTAAKPAMDAGLTVAFGGEVPETFSAPSGTAEAVGVVAALIILLIALDSLLSAGLPILVALVGVGVGSAIITLLAAVVNISTTAPTIASMVGLGVGIDYALLLVSRQVEGLRRGLSPVEAAAETTATAGSSVILAGLTVLVSLFGLKFSTLPTYASFGYATFAVVTMVMTASITLVPAVLGLAGRRVLPRSARIGRHVRHAVITHTEKWARRVGTRPVPWALAALVLLAARAAPALGMRTWPQDAGSQPTSNTTRVAYDLIAAEYGAGANGPILVVIDLKRAKPKVVVNKLRKQTEVAALGRLMVNRAGDAAMIAVQPRTGPQDERTSAFIERLRSVVLPRGVMATGMVVAYADISERLSERLWVVVAFVVGLSLLLLVVLFRSPVVAVKAALMNMMSVGAAYGVITVIFQTDVGARAIGLPHAGAVSSWVPILMFTVLFGLSMDYEVFLLSRIREDWEVTGDGRGSVVRGLSATGRVITSAAAIMIAVFAGFAIDSDVTVKTIGIGMATAILIDATIVRMVLVPATMAMLGGANWWLPRWLDRVLPRISHGEAAPLPSYEPSGHAVQPIRPITTMRPEAQPRRRVPLSRKNRSPRTVQGNPRTRRAL
jgi:RND superfamily putative drug exporter